MKLYELAWGLYPRRVGIYLAEKGITSIERVSFDLMAGWPPPELAQEPYAHAERAPRYRAVVVQNQGTSCAVSVEKSLREEAR